LATIYDVAKLAKVSAMTVSRVINNSPSIKEETRQKVLKAIEELDYIPNRSAQSLISKDSKLLSLVITDISNPFYTNVARGAEDKANERGYQVVFSNSDENFEKESAYVRAAISRGIDGMLFTPSGDKSIENIKLMQKHKIPIVLVDRTLDNVELDVVTGDNLAGTKKLMNYLYELGHRKIGLVTGPATISTTILRDEGYTKFIKEKGLPFDKRWVFRTDLTKRRTSSFIEQLMSLQKDERPTAVFCNNNFLAVDLLNSMIEYGLHVPEDISVVCFDDPQPIPMPDSFLTVVRQQPYDFGYVGMEILIDRIEGNNSQQMRKVIYTPELIIRNSAKKLEA
jgi:LacI family transcriptional regulator